MAGTGKTRRYQDFHSGGRSEWRDGDGIFEGLKIEGGLEGGLGKLGLSDSVGVYGPISRVQFLVLGLITVLIDCHFFSQRSGHNLPQLQLNKFVFELIFSLCPIFAMTSFLDINYSERLHNKRYRTGQTNNLFPPLRNALFVLQISPDCHYD